MHRARVPVRYFVKCKGRIALQLGLVSGCDMRPKARLCFNVMVMRG